MHFWKNPIKYIIILLCFTGTIFCQDIVLKVNPNESRLPIGFIELVPAANESRRLPLDLGRVVVDDLTFSGRVKVIESLNPDSSGLHYFLHNEAYAYISGTYQYKNNKIEIRFYLKDSETQELILGKKYTVKRSSLRKAAHMYSDEIIYQLFGEKGIAQTKVVFVSKQSGNKEIYMMDYDGANTKRLTANKGMNLLPCWLRGNASILYTSYQLGNPQLFIKHLPNGQEQIFIHSKFLNTGPDYNSIDGEIVYTSSVKGNTEIFRIAESGGKPVRLTYSKALEASPSWSPNGYEIVFVSGRSGPPMLYIMDRDGSNTRRLTYDGRYNTSPSWSPRGDKIAFCSMTENGGMDIYTIKPTGKEFRRLTSGAGSNEHPSWSPDGRAIVFTSTRLGRKELYMMREDGSHQKQLTSFGNNSSPDWSYY